MTRKLSILSTGLCLFGLAGCASYPISKPVRREAEATKRISFGTIAQNPGAYLGRTVIWGGRILQIVNDTNQASIYLLEAPLDDWEQPESTRLSQGRFIARASGFLDPEIYHAGARLTVAGEIVGAETQSLGKVAYNYPVIHLRELVLWRPAPAYYGVPPPAGPWPWFGAYGPYFDGFYSPYYYYPGYYPPYFGGVRLHSR